MLKQSDIDAMNCSPCRKCGHPELCHVLGCLANRPIQPCATYQPVNEDAEPLKGEL